MLTTRIIPVLLLRNRGLYKGIQFKNHTYVGDPINTVKIFNDKEVDEIVVLDIEATVKNKPIDFEYLEEVVSEAFMPIGYGGGIKTIEDAKRIFSIGVEKVILNTQAFKTPELVSELSKKFGAQSVVVSLDVKKTLLGSFVYIKNGTEKTSYKPLEAAKLMESFGAGEIIINDIDKDGTRTGYNLSYIQEISKSVKIPVIVCGGAATVEDFVKAKQAGAHACAAGAMFVYHGPHRAVLISYPKYEELRKSLGE
ncbi:MAG TPA: AglZ/HisF2 family acetamidino modification protein [Spirochaetales bacterium]|nr:AglZ/HisF2 family acetamidino modification protein [Spirochaetales bacterium]HQK35001.1 AglZ/HisF2 family acetamidino modification protein [Spirochaetales bacterium]